MAELVAGLIAVHGSLSFTAGAWWVSDPSGNWSVWLPVNHRSTSKLIRCCLADRTNRRAYATVLRLSSVTYLLWLNGASWSKSYYWEPIGSHILGIDWYRNEWPWPLSRGRIKVMSISASHSPLNISEIVKDRETRFQMTTSRKLPTKNQTVTWPWKVKLVTQYA